MNYISTRNNSKEFTFENVFIKGLAEDGGLFVPKSIKKFSGLVLMGGPMSVNEKLDWIPSVLSLIKEAYKVDKPLLGHCLGGQLISKSLGAKVIKNKSLEIGWFKVQICRWNFLKEN